MKARPKDNRIVKESYNIFVPAGAAADGRRPDQEVVLACGKTERRKDCRQQYCVERSFTLLTQAPQIRGQRCWEIEVVGVPAECLRLRAREVDREIDDR